MANSFCGEPGNLVDVKRTNDLTSPPTIVFHVGKNISIQCN